MVMRPHSSQAPYLPALAIPDLGLRFPARGLYCGMRPIHVPLETGLIRADQSAARYLALVTDGSRHICFLFPEHGPSGKPQLG